LKKNQIKKICFPINNQLNIKWWDLKQISKKDLKKYPIAIDKNEKKKGIVS
jgi:hypothetical protein